MSEHLMTDEEFLREARAWADRVRAQAKAAAAGFPKGKKTATHTYKTGLYAGKTEGKLRRNLTVKLRKRYGDLEALSFKMPVHGIFRTYGVGNGQPRHGVATKSGKAASQKVYLKRSMSDWFYGPLERNEEALADLVADYYGDKVLVEFRKLDINRVAHQGVL
jgi:hypothetical protein